METIIDLINSVGFPIFACVYLGSTNSKILNTIDKRLEIIELRLAAMERKQINE